MGYDSKEMIPYRNMIDDVTRLFLDYGRYSGEYRKLRTEIYERDKAIKRSAKAMGIKAYDKCYLDIFDQDLRRRMGNAVIQKVIEDRRKGFAKFSSIENQKYRRRKELTEIARMLKRSSYLSDSMDEDEKAFLDYEKALWKANIERLIEEGILDRDTLEPKDDYEM